MKVVVIILVCILCSEVISGQTEGMKTNDTSRCLLAESIALELTNNLNKDSVNDILQQKSSDEILQDLCSYAGIFEEWAKQPVPSGRKPEGKTKIERLFNVWKQEDSHMKPIQQYGGIISFEMIEIANRHKTEAMPYLERIAQTELPDFKNVAISAKIKGRYQNPAAEAWLRLSMPKDLRDDEKKAWLLDFIEQEQKKGAEQKKWAIDRAEWLLYKMEKEKVVSE